MADTISDVSLTNIAYTDIYDETGISVGTALVIQNKTKSNVILQLTASQPTVSSTDGYLLEPDAKFPVKVEAGENGVWAIGSGPLGVQER